MCNVLIEIKMKEVSALVNMKNALINFSRGLSLLLGPTWTDFYVNYLGGGNLLWHQSYFSLLGAFWPEHVKNKILPKPDYPH